MRKQILGQHGEELAVEHLKTNGYRILERNFRNHLGEIDIIAEQEGVICFIEVKTRTSDDFGAPLEAISKTKQHKLSQVALSYLLKHKGLDQEARFDVVAIIENKGSLEELEILTNAFELSPKYSY